MIIYCCSIQLLRSSPILEYSPDALLVIVIIGSTTAFFAGTCGLLGNDLKRIIAFSTIVRRCALFIQGVEDSIH